MISIKKMDDRIGKKFSDLRERHQGSFDLLYGSRISRPKNE